MRSLSTAVALFIGILTAAPPAMAQASGRSSDTALRGQVERRFEVLPLEGGIALRPRGRDTGVRAIEITDAGIAIDGAPVTGAELSGRLGEADAGLVLRLSYLNAAERQAMFGGSATAPAPPAPAVQPNPPAPPAEPEEPSVRRRHHGRTTQARVRIGSNITVDPDETVTDDVVCIGGSADVQGRVIGNVVVIGGTATLGPSADVSGDVSVVGGTLRRDPGAHVGGRVNEVAIGGLEGLGGLDYDRRRLFPLGLLALAPMWHGLALASTMMRLAVLCLLACIVVLLGSAHVDRIGARAAAEPIKAGLIGLLAELLFVPLLVVTVIVLVVTIIGIPLLLLVPFVVLAAIVVALVGFTAVASRIGRTVSARFGWSEANPYLLAITGTVAVFVPVLLGRIVGIAGPLALPITAALLALGFLVEYLAWTVGIGALALNRFSRPLTPPPTAATPTPA